VHNCQSTSSTLNDPNAHTDHRKKRTSRDGTLRLYQSRGDVILTGRDECDLSSEQSIKDTVGRVKPTVIINAGAYTAVDQAEKEPGLCFAINAHAPRVLAQEAARSAPCLSITPLTTSSTEKRRNPTSKATH